MEYNGIWTLYCHKNKINNKRYFGITCQEPENRWMNGHGYAGHLPIGRAIKKYGWDNFEHIIIFKNLIESDAKKLEVLYIAMYETQSDEYGYNLTCGGDGVCGLEWSDESRRKMSIRMSGENHPNFGKHLSLETRRKISENNRWKHNHLKGIPISESHKQHISESNSKAVNAYDDNGNLILSFPSARKAAQALDVNYKNISLCIHGERKRCGGYHWSFA